MYAGRLYVWENNSKQQIVVMNTEDNKYIVVHSDGLVSFGSYMNIDNNFKPFIGTVNMVSEERHNET